MCGVCQGQPVPNHCGLCTNLASINSVSQQKVNLPATDHNKGNFCQLDMIMKVTSPTSLGFFCLPNLKKPALAEFGGVLEKSIHAMAEWNSGREHHLSGAETWISNKKTENNKKLYNENEMNIHRQRINAHLSLTHSLWNREKDVW